MNIINKDKLRKFSIIMLKDSDYGQAGKIAVLDLPSEPLWDLFFTKGMKKTKCEVI